MSNRQRSTVHRQVAIGNRQVASADEEGVKGGEDGVVGREDKFREAILERTHYGMRVYARVLRQYYQDEVVLLLSGNTCKPAKNPFNGDKKTLHVSIVDGLARHFDAEVEGCRGDAFDFADMHYKMEGMELLEKLNEELDLGILKNQLAMGNGQLAICNRQLAVCNEQRMTGEGEMGEDVGNHTGCGVNGVTVEQVGKESESHFPQFTQFTQFTQMGNSEEIDQLAITKRQSALGINEQTIDNRQLDECVDWSKSLKKHDSVKKNESAGSNKSEREGSNKSEGQGGNKLEVEGGNIVVPQFSFFKKPVRNTLPSGNISLMDVYKKIKGVGYRKQTNLLRAIQNEKEARAFKSEQFDYVTFSGTFTKRGNSALVQHSGLFAVDLDHLEDVEGLRARLLQDPYFETVLLFVSPSGNGLKWIIPIDLSKATHQEYAKAISNYLLHKYGQKMDASGKDVARACFLPCDPEVYINPKYYIQKHTPSH